MITWFFVTLVFAATGWISWKVRKRRQTTWIQRDRYHQPLLTVRVAEKLGIQRAETRSDVGLQLREAVERRIAERPAPDIEAEIAAIEEFARKRGLP